MHPHSSPTVRFPSTAAYPHRTDPSTAAYTPKTPVHRHLELRVPLVSAPPRLPRRLQDARHTVHLTTSPSHPSTHTSSPRRRPWGLQAVPATPCNTPRGRRNAVTPQTTPCTPGVSRATTPNTSVAGPPVETPVPWEYPTGVWALLPWSGRPMTPHCCMRRPGAGGLKHPCLTLMHGGSTAHQQAGTTCHITLAVIRRLPVPHNQAMKALLYRRYPLRCVQRRDGSRCTHNS